MYAYIVNGIILFICGIAGKLFEIANIKKRAIFNDRWETATMSSDLLNIKGGVFVVGSLLWQDYLEEESDNVRKNWRDNNLTLSGKIMVKAPIRYGRLSKGNIFTMVFSNSCSRKKMGTGYFIPFQQTPTPTFEDVVSHSKELSKAEGMDGQFIRKSKDGNAWGVLGILINPTVNKNIAKNFYDKWNEKIKNDGGFNPVDFRLGHERFCITKKGKLNFKWPTAIDEQKNKTLNSYDYIIATVTKPKNSTKPLRYPNVKELADSVRNDRSRYYFIENYKAGITTFQDISVINNL